jgi:hypothetical protein
MTTTFMSAKNLAWSRLASGISDSATELTVLTGDGAVFPSAFPFCLSIEDEIVFCTNGSGDVMTIVRAQEGTSAVSHAINVAIENSITAKYITELNTAVNALEVAPPAHTHEALPVGFVFISVVSTNPNTLLGYGTWATFGAGRVLVGLDSGDVDFDTAEKTGGAKTVQASAQTFGGTELATHQHAAITAGTPAGTNTPGAATSVVQPYFVCYFWKRTA